MKTFKKVLDIIIGVTALVLIAALILSAFNFNYNNFLGAFPIYSIIGYALPVLVSIVCIRFTIGKTVWLILTIIFVAFALWIYFDTAGFFGFMHSIFG